MLPGESLSLLRSRHDTNIQTLMMEVRNKQLEEAQKTKESLEENRKAPVHRLEYYQQLVGEEVSVPDKDAEFTLLVNDIPLKPICSLTYNVFCIACNLLFFVKIIITSITLIY